MIKTGTRVRHDTGLSDNIYGTAIVGPEIAERCGTDSAVLVCLDKADARADDFNYLTGVHRGRLFLARELLTTNVYETEPSNVAAFAKRDFSWEGVFFRRGDRGRRVTGNPPGQVMVDWAPSCKKNDGAGRFYQRIEEGKKYNNCWAVNSAYLGWGRLDQDGHLASVWPDLDTLPDVKKGDYLKYTYRNPTRLLLGSKTISVQRGAILKCNGIENNICHIEVVAGAPTYALGAIGRIKMEMVTLCEAPPFLNGDIVEIGASLDFKGRDLRGLRGTVLLPIDEDGDVGVEFNKDVRAGSLDGKGSAGRCLYVPGDKLRKKSE